MAYYVVKCAYSAGGAGLIYTFPTGCRVSGGSVTRRTNLVAIPYADGTKDTSDGKLDTGDVTVSGRIYAANGAATIALIDTMEHQLLTTTTAFFVMADWAAGTTKSYPVHCCKSVSHTQVEGTAGIWIDIECVFARGPDPDMV